VQLLAASLDDDPTVSPTFASSTAASGTNSAISRSSTLTRMSPV
jgi:hypothetical protein